MRMPIFSYFIVVGTALVGLMIWVGNETEPSGSPVKTSQIVGLPKPFKAPPDTAQHKLTGVNFAAARAREVPAPKPVKNVESPRKQFITNKPSNNTPTWNRLAEFPYDRLSIH